MAVLENHRNGFSARRAGMMHAGTVPSRPNGNTAEYARLSAIRLLESIP